MAAVNLRKQYIVRSIAMHTPVPSAEPYKPPQSRWGRQLVHQKGESETETEDDAGDQDPEHPEAGAMMLSLDGGRNSVDEARGMMEGSRKRDDLRVAVDATEEGKGRHRTAGGLLPSEEGLGRREGEPVMRQLAFHSDPSCTEEQQGEGQDVGAARVLAISGDETEEEEGSVAEHEHISMTTDQTAASQRLETDEKIWGNEGNENSGVGRATAMPLIHESKKWRSRIEHPERLRFVPKWLGGFEWGGILGWLSTCGGTRPHRNSADLGLVRVTASSPWVWGRAENIVEHTPKLSASPSQIGAWVCVELRDGVSISPTHYSVRHGLVRSLSQVIAHFRKIKGTLSSLLAHSRMQMLAILFTPVASFSLLQG